MKTRRLAYQVLHIWPCTYRQRWIRLYPYLRRSYHKAIQQCRCIYFIKCADYLPFHYAVCLQQWGPNGHVTEEVNESHVVQSHLVVNKLPPNFFTFHVLSNVVHSSFKYLFAFFLILIYDVMILDGKINKTFPKFYLGRIVS